MIRIFKAAAIVVTSAVFMGIILAQLPVPQVSAPPPPPPVVPKPEELAKVREKTEQIDKLVGDLRAKHADPVLLNDVEVYAKAGRMLLEYPELFGTQAAIDRSFEVLDQGIERAHQLIEGKPQWEQGTKRIEAYRSEIDGALQPYGLTFPANYDPSKPVRLYVWLHGRSNNQTEAEFISRFLRPRPPENAPVADQGQIQLDCFGRINGAGWHWAGEADVFEAIAAVKKRYRIDDKRVMLRAFSMGGEGAWHISLHHPDAFVAAEVGAGTVPDTVQRRAARGLPSLQPFQLRTLNIWENYSDWVLNIYNIPLAGHDGENDPTGQFESSIHARTQLEKEGFPSEGERDYKRSIGVPGLWMLSLNTGHGTSPLVRQRLDAFLKEWGDKGQIEPDHLRFVTYTTRYNKDYWASVDGMDKLYERADIDVVRSDSRESYEIKTHNVSRLMLREMDRAKEIRIDEQDLKPPSRPELALQKSGSTWRIDSSLSRKGLHKTHGLQGPIDDAFLEPFLMVRPTGRPWNDEVNQQALRTMAHFDRMWGKFFRGHPLVKDDKDVTEADIAKYHIVLFGDPGSNQLIAKLQGKLPVKWTKETVTLAGKDFSAKENFPALVYPNPLNPSKYVVLNSGLDIDDAGYNGDYGTPLWGDYAVVKVKAGAEMPDLQTGGLFNETGAWLSNIQATYATRYNEISKGEEMKLLLTLTTLLATATLLTASDETSGVSFVDHDKVAVALSKAGPIVGLEGTGTYNVHISRRVKPGPAEAHVKDTDFFYILEGSATVIAGGTMVGGKETRPGLIVGSDIRGGQTYHLSKGDVMVIPAGIPHWFKEVPTSIDYYTVQAAVEPSKAK